MELTTEQKWDAIKDAKPLSEIWQWGGWRTGEEGWSVGVKVNGIPCTFFGSGETREEAIADAYSRLPAKPAPLKEFAMSHGNIGHGHVFPRPDGVLAHCGGPGLCQECSLDLGRKMRESDKRLKAHASVISTEDPDFLKRMGAVPEPLSGGASDGEMGDEQWVKAHLPDEELVSTHFCGDGYAWWEIRRGANGSSHVFGSSTVSADAAWLDARRRLTPEAAAEEARCGLRVLGMPCTLPYNHSGPCMIASLIHEAGASLAPALKAQAAEKEIVGGRRCTHKWVNEGPDTSVFCDWCGHFRDSASASPDLASLTKRLVAALEKRHRRDRIASRRNHEYMLSSDSCYKEECDVLAEAKKVGCA